MEQVTLAVGEYYQEQKSAHELELSDGYQVVYSQEHDKYYCIKEGGSRKCLTYSSALNLF